MSTDPCATVPPAASPIDAASPTEVHAIMHHIEKAIAILDARPVTEIDNAAWTSVYDASHGRLSALLLLRRIK